MAAHVHHARADPADRDRGADLGAPRDHRASEALAVPGARAHRAQRRGHANVAGLRTALDRADAVSGGRAVPARRAGADQPDLGVGAVPHLSLDERRAARLVPRLADRRDAADAELRADRRRRHAGAQPVLGGVLFPTAVFVFLYAWPA